MAFIYGYRDNVHSSLGNSAMTDIRYAEPHKVLQHWPYSVACVRWGYDKGTSLFGEFGNKGTTPEIKQRMHDLHYQLLKLANRDLYSNKPSRYVDNKETYLFETEQGEKIAVFFKDGNAHFGKPADIRAYDGEKIRGIAGVVEVEGRLVNCRGEVIDESPPKEIPIELRSILVES